MDDFDDARAGVGARIRVARIAAGYENAAEFARLVGIGGNSMYRWEAGRIVPDIFSLARVAKVAGVSMEWLALGQEQAPSPARAVLATWRATPIGETASPEAIRFLESLPLEGYTPTLTFYDLALVAFASHLDAETAARGARLTESALR